jgi:hypothetical protein
VREGRFERHFGDTMTTDLPELAVDGDWPLVRLLGAETAIVALASARPNPEPWRSSGRIPPRQLAATTQLLADPRLASRFVFLATHYAPRLADGRPDTRGHGLENAEDLLSAIASVERGVLLHGHIHRCYTVRVPGVGPSLFGAGSATYSGHEGCWLFEVLPAATATTRRGRWRDGTWTLDEAIPITPASQPR